MKEKLSQLSRLLVNAVVILLLTASSMAQADEEGLAVVAGAAVAVDVITALDADSRSITLKTETGEKVTFTAGPEVRNFDQLKRGDLIILEYYSGLAVALEPKGSSLEQRAEELDIERAKKGEKPGAKVTSSIYVSARVVEIDQEDRLVALEGPENVLVLQVGDDLDLAALEVGQEVEALYVESFAVSVVAAPKLSGTVTMKSTAVALGVGVQWGEGTLSMYDGTEYEFKVGGLTLLDVGVAVVEASGEVYELVEAKDLEGIYLVGEAGAALVGGGSALAMKNDNGVVLKLKSTQKGARLTLAGEGLKISLK